MYVIDKNRRPLGRACSITALAIVASILLCACVPRGAVFPRGELAGSDEQADYDTAMTRLAGMVGKVQQVEGLVPQESIATVVASLNQALDKLELARVALSGGFLAQASANITAANAVMNGLDAPIAALLARADDTRRTNLLMTVAGVGLACAAVVLLLLFKRRHDEKKLRAFLDAEIDYTAMDSGAKGADAGSSSNI